MASIINLEELPQLAMEKITSFLNHKQLLTLEQASTKLKCAVDDHFSITDHLIIGPLPAVDQFSTYDEASTNDKKWLDGLLKIIKRCGIRLRTIQITTTYYFPHCAPIWHYNSYCKHFLASVEVSNNCPNIENILASPNMDIITMLDNDMFRQKSVLLHEDNAEIYANNIKLSTGGTCKLRSINLSSRRIPEDVEHSYERILDLFSNLEQISVCYPDENFYNILPQLIENGLKDLRFIGRVDLRIAKEYCNIWKDLRTLRFDVTVGNVDDITALNELQLPENVEIKIEIYHVADCFALLNENVCNFIINCEVYGPIDYKLISKLKNVQALNMTTLEELQLIAEGSFPQLRKIRNNSSLCCSVNCVNAETCALRTFLPQLLLNEGNHLTHIVIHYICQKSMPLVWKALKHCHAAVSIRFIWVDVDSYLTVTYEDVDAIYLLPTLQEFMFSILQKPEEDVDLLHELFARAEKEHADFRLEFESFKLSYCCQEQQFSLYRINF